METFIPFVYSKTYPISLKKDEIAPSVSTAFPLSPKSQFSPLLQNEFFKGSVKSDVNFLERFTKLKKSSQSDDHYSRPISELFDSEFIRLVISPIEEQTKKEKGYFEDSINFLVKFFKD